MKLKFILVTLLFFLVKPGTSQTFDCYITNDTLVSKTQFEFDVFLKSTSEDFLFRTIQLAIAINPEFTPSGESPEISYVEGSSNIKMFKPGRFKTSESPNFSFFLMTSSNSPSCKESTIISNKPVRVGRFIIKSKSGNFTSAQPNIKLIGPKEKVDKETIKFKMSVTKWSTLDCSVPTAVLLNNFGNYFTK
jgi:hypothetical protein